MDITDTTPQRIEVAVNLFLDGYPLKFRGVVFSKAKDKCLTINSYSEWNIENTTPEMAKDEISRSKEVLNELMNKSQKFKDVAVRLPHQFFFCIDYGNGAVSLAKEINGKFVWLH